MNLYLASKISSFFVANLGSGVLLRPTSCIHAVVRNSLLLRAIRALYLNNLDRNLLRPELIRGSLKILVNIIDVVTY